MRQAVEGMPTCSVKGTSVVSKVYSNSRFYQSMSTIYQAEQRESAKENKMMREGRHRKKVILIVWCSEYLCQNNLRHLSLCRFPGFSSDLLNLFLG